jgi:hypothetical protein
VTCIDKIDTGYESRPDQETSEKGCPDASHQADRETGLAVDVVVFIQVTPPHVTLRPHYRLDLKPENIFIQCINDIESIIQSGLAIYQHQTQTP